MFGAFCAYYATQPTTCSHHMKCCSRALRLEASHKTHSPLLNLQARLRWRSLKQREASAGRLQKHYTSPRDNVPRVMCVLRTSGSDHYPRQRWRGRRDLSSILHCPRCCELSSRVDGGRYNTLMKSSSNSNRLRDLLPSNLFQFRIRPESYASFRHGAQQGWRQPSVEREEAGRSHSVGEPTDHARVFWLLPRGQLILPWCRKSRCPRQGN